MANPEKNLPIELLRGVSILLVFLFHLELPHLESGFLGVDIFFVISGYLMAKLYGDINTPRDAIAYWYRRLKRLFPAYVASLALLLLVSSLIVLPHEMATMSGHALWSVAYLPNVGFWMDASYFNRAQLRPFLNFWSLGVEVQFYLVFPMLAGIVRGRRFGLLFVLGLLSLAAYAAMNQVSPKTSFFLTPFRIWEFTIGIGIAMSALRAQPLLGGTALLGLLMVVLGASIWPELSTMPTLIVTLLTGMVIAWGLPERFERSVPGRCLAVLGRYSYSIYLVHFPVIVLVSYVPFQGTLQRPSGLGALAAILVLTAAASITLFHGIEQPLRRRLPASRVLRAQVLASAGLLLVIGVTHDIPGRLCSEEQRSISLAFLDRAPYRCPKLSRLIDPFADSCRLGTSSDEGGVLLVGDSHADAIKSALERALEPKRRALWLMKRNQSLGRGYTPQEVLDEALLRRAGVIAVHSSDTGISVPALEELIRRTAAHHISVVFIAPVPTYPAHIPELLYAETLGHERPSASSWDSAWYETRHDSLLKQVSELEARRSSFRVLLPHQMLCRPRCRLKHEDGRPLYFDAGHLTLTGAQELVSLFDPIASF